MVEQLTTQEIATFKRDGYIIKKRCLDPHLLSRARDRLWSGNTSATLLLRAWHCSKLAAAAAAAATHMPLRPQHKQQQQQRRQPRSKRSLKPRMRPMRNRMMSGRWQTTKPTAKL